MVSSLTVVHHCNNQSQIASRAGDVSRGLRWSWLVGQSEGFFKVYFDWLIVPSSNGIVLPNRADVNVVVRVRPGW